MEQEIRVFLNKFIASLCLKGVDSIPFAVEEFQKGIKAVEAELKKSLSTDDFNKLADAFVKVPVEEIYQDICSMFMTLNGYGIGFSGADNPQWSTMTIKMKPYSAQRIIADNSVFSIEPDILSSVTNEFCEAAGVPLWEMF